MWWRVTVYLGKTLNAISHFEAKQSTRCGGSAWRKTCNRTASVLEWYDRHRTYDIWFKTKNRLKSFDLFLTIQVVLTTTEKCPETWLKMRYFLLKNSKITQCWGFAPRPLVLSSG